MKTDGAIPSIERKAVTEIDMSCLQVEEQIAIAGLTADAARLFVEQRRPLKRSCRACRSLRSPVRPSRRSPSN
jgi:hypothetical protein